MKNLLVVLVSLLVVTFMSGCGLQNQINDLKGRADRNEGEIGDIKSRLAALESDMASSKTQLVALNDALSSQGAGLMGQILNINNQLAAISAAGSASDAQIAQLQADLSQAISDASVLEGRVSAAEGSNATVALSVSQLQSDLAATNSTVANYASLGTNAYNQIQGQISALSSSTAGVTSNVSVLQSSVNSALVQIAVLQGYTSIVSIKDPCGAQGAYNEVFLKLSSGKYLASFSENGSALTTRFVVLTDGNFQTTDGSNCKFTVSGDGTVISNEHN